MNIAITSDLHLEFGYWNPVNKANSDVLILGGDICVARDISRDFLREDASTRITTNFFKEACKNYKDVIYILGNHEHYHGDFATTASIVNEMIDKNKNDMSNLHFLDTNSVKIGDVTFIGGTMWTDMNDNDTMTMRICEGMMNDYRGVRNSKHEAEFGPRSFSPADSVEYFNNFINYVSDVIAKNPDEKYVVVTHHAPSKSSTHPRYQFDIELNGAYSSDLDNFIMEHPQIKLWTHGHTHHKFSYKIGKTKVKCNPRGYVGYERSDDESQPYLPLIVTV